MDDPDRPARLLVVDDHEDNRDLLVRRLTRAGYRVEAAADGRRALDWIDAHPCDLVLLDIMMPGLSGLDVLSRVRSRHPLTELPVIMATARTGSDDVIEALAAGANDYVVKPIDFPVLRARIATQIELLRLRRDRERLMAEKDEFLAIASHDLRNPLARVRGFARLLQGRFPEGRPMTAEGREMLALLVRATDAMQDIVEDFLELKALESGRLRLASDPVVVDELLREATSSMRPLAEEGGLTLLADLGCAGVRLGADRRRLTQIVQNLLDNALKFCRPGDTITVRSRCDDAEVTMEVSDDGPGFAVEPSPDHAPEPVVKDPAPGGTAAAPPRAAPTAVPPRPPPAGGTAGAGPSTQYGLPLCHRLARLHGGRLEVSAAPGAGATLRLVLPRPPSPAPDSDETV